LASDEFTKEVRNDEEAGYKEGVHGVPYFMVGNEVINGAASKESMKNTLLKVLNNENEKKKNDGHPEGVVCDETGCYFNKSK
jgi:predicted DsbA family dithiol-disulfide isomerase